MCFLLLFLYFNVILYHCADAGAASNVKSQGKGITLKVKNRKFVEEIKQELTNNNDDYLESSPLTPTPPRVPPLDIRRRYLNANNTPNTTNSSSPQIENETKERERSCSLELNTVTSQEKTPKGIDVRESKNPANPRFQPTSFGRSVDTATTRMRKKKSRKPRKSKSKDLLKSLLKDPMVARARDSAYVALSPPPRHQMRARLELSREKAPDSNQLDMAPAQGGRIDNMRFKNRLCQRNVLLPEGPKYDSRGRIYLAAYAGRGPGADYARTRPRRLVLPRCCNCCRKSVLGCE